MTARGTMRLYLGASVRSATPGVSSPKTCGATFQIIRESFTQWNGTSDGSPVPRFQRRLRLWFLEGDRTAGH